MARHLLPPMLVLSLALASLPAAGATGNATILDGYVDFPCRIFLTVTIVDMDTSTAVIDLENGVPQCRAEFTRRFIGSGNPEEGWTGVSSTHGLVIAISPLGGKQYSIEIESTSGATGSGLLILARSSTLPPPVDSTMTKAYVLTGTTTYTKGPVTCDLETVITIVPEPEGKVLIEGEFAYQPPCMPVVGSVVAEGTGNAEEGWMGEIDYPLLELGELVVVEITPLGAGAYELFVEPEDQSFRFSGVIHQALEAAACYPYNPAALTNACIEAQTSPSPVCIIGDVCVDVPVPAASGYVEATVVCGTAPCRADLP